MSREADEDVRIDPSPSPRAYRSGATIATTDHAASGTVGRALPITPLRTPLRCAIAKSDIDRSNADAMKPTGRVRRNINGKSSARRNRGPLQQQVTEIASLEGCRDDSYLKRDPKLP